MKGKINLIIVNSIQVVMIKTSAFIEDINKYQAVEFTPTPPDLKWRLFGSVRWRSFLTSLIAVESTCRAQQNKNCDTLQGYIAIYTIMPVSQFYTQKLW